MSLISSRKSVLLITSLLVTSTQSLLQVVPGRVELPTSTLSVWRSNQLSYRTGRKCLHWCSLAGARLHLSLLVYLNKTIGEKYARPDGLYACLSCVAFLRCRPFGLQKGGVPAAPSGTATLLRLSPNYQYHSRPTLAVTAFKCSRLSWLDGRCVQGPGTYSPRHG